MISPHTPPGTKVIALRESRTFIGWHDRDNTVPGEAYTILTIEEDANYQKTGYCTQLAEMPSDCWYCLSLFRLPITPDSIASHKNTIDEPTRSPRKTKQRESV